MSDQGKEDVQRKILEQIVLSLEKEDLKTEDVPVISRFVLEKIDQIANEEQLTFFLNELSQKWPVFEGLLVIEKGKEKEKNDQIVASQVLELAKDGKIEEALSLAKNATEN